VAKKGCAVDFLLWKNSRYPLDKVENKNEKKVVKIRLFAKKNIILRGIFCLNVGGDMRICSHKTLIISPLGLAT
jgi:hypothetical protein